MASVLSLTKIRNDLGPRIWPPEVLALIQEHHCRRESAQINFPFAISYESLKQIKKFAQKYDNVSTEEEDLRVKPCQIP